MESGVYKIYWPVQGYFYYGQAQHLKKRKSIHFARLKKGTHENSKVQRVFNKYGLPVFEVVSFCELNKLDEIEQTYLDQHFNDKFCCNFCPTASSIRGYKLSPELRKRISDRRKGTPLSEIHKIGISAGLTLAYETGKMKRQDLNGVKNPMFGKKHSAEFKARLSAIKKEKYLGGSNPNARIVLNMQTGIYYDSIKDAAASTHKTRSAVFHDMYRCKSNFVRI